MKMANNRTTLSAPELAKLDPGLTHREVNILMLWYDNQTSADIAERLGMPEPEVIRLLAPARNRLKKALQLRGLVLQPRGMQCEEVVREEKGNEHCIHPARPEGTGRASERAENDRDDNPQGRE